MVNFAQHPQNARTTISWLEGTRAPGAVTPIAPLALERLSLPSSR
jgi:hypothetical protein